MEIPLITKENFFQRSEKRERPWEKDYLVMYCSLWGGATKDPDLMLIPIDDHLVHRGDGVFDVMRCIGGSIYQMEAHLARLERSASAIYLAFPGDYEAIRDVIKRLVVMGGAKECLIRVLLSRGPGSFSTNPYDCPETQLYVNVFRHSGVRESYYREGIPLVTSPVPIKKSFFANIKSCNYLPNVLMKMDAIRAGCEYSVSLDEEGFLAEGSTENVAVLSDADILKFPGLERTLSGITADRVVELAADLVKDGMIKDVQFTQISQEEAYRSKEMFLTGTSLGLLPVVRYDERPIGAGVPGTVYNRLSSLLWEDMTKNESLLTRLDWE